MATVTEPPAWESLLRALAHGEPPSPADRDAAAPLAALAWSLAAHAPSAHVWTEVADALDRAAPLAHHAGRVADCLAVPRATAEALLEGADDEAAYVPGPRPWLGLIHLEHGIEMQVIAGLVRVPPGRVFPRHNHLGEETVLVLRGGFRDDEGRVHRAGELLRTPGGIEHEITALPDEPLLFLSVNEVGLVLDGIELRAG
ncbi:MAG: cupin domain-containing protein, partial [Myxococcales bacterium]|nr:cupin domain-containing protein [Myxococcales bacterium]